MKPILFNTDMVRAILEDRKTVMRRVVKRADSRWNFYELGLDPAMAKVGKDGTEYPVDVPGLWATFESVDGPIEYPMVKSPYRPGDILYVRETWCINNITPHDPEWNYKADYDCTVKPFCRKNRQGGQTVEAGQKDIGNWWRVYGMRTKSVTHWMPMPDPPEEEIP